MNVKPWLLALCVLCLILGAAGQKSSPKPDPVASSRYQLVPAQIEQNGKTVGALFLLDTQEGRVWRHQSSGESSDGKAYPQAFAPVGIGIPVVDKE
jgi:hypothetical protein